MRIEDGFQQLAFSEPNAFTSDPVLPDLLRRILPDRIYLQVEPDLTRLGDEITNKIRPIGALVAPPTLTQYDQWGRRIDRLQTSEGWKKFKEISQQEGLPAIFYERPYGEHSRVYGFAKVVMMVADTHMIFCPMSMTDGCARVVELNGSSEMKKHIFPRLTSREPSTAFTSGQWMTERPGGSDLSQTETTARSLGKSNLLGAPYILDGFKWFSSATDSDVALVLASTGDAKLGSRSLSLFLVPVRFPFIPSNPPLTLKARESGPPANNNIFVHRLKNKIGTHALPTAELSIEGAEGYLIGAPGEGVKSISPVLNITRMWSAVSMVGYLRRCLSIATAYAEVRSINTPDGPRFLKEMPSHVAQLARIGLVYRALTHLIFGAVRLLGKVECNGKDARDRMRLRLLTPVCKAFAAEIGIGAMEEAMVCLGGQGYMEENQIGRLIRDALVERIWEGTTVILALDISRAAKDKAVLESFISWAEEILSSCPEHIYRDLQTSFNLLRFALSNIQRAYSREHTSPLFPRPALFLLGYTASSLYLLEHAIWSTAQGHGEVDVEAFRRWVNESGLSASIEDVKKAMDDPELRSRQNAAIVYGKAKM